jgi:hypothetical protein
MDSPNRMKPMTRVVQAKPTWGNKDWNSSGNMIPPMDPLVTAMPVAVPRRSLK